MDVRIHLSSRVSCGDCFALQQAGQNPVELEDGPTAAGGGGGGDGEW